MRSVLLSFALLAAMLVPSALISAPASAEPSADTWYCANAYEWVVLQKSQFYGCAMSSILVIDSYSGNRKRLLDGYCANQLHIFKPASTWRDAYYQCKIKDF